MRAKRRLRVIDGRPPSLDSSSRTDSSWVSMKSITFLSLARMEVLRSAVTSSDDGMLANQRKASRSTSESRLWIRDTRSRHHTQDQNQHRPTVAVWSSCATVHQGRCRAAVRPANKRAGPTCRRNVWTFIRCGGCTSSLRELSGF